jgi:hypothetical protein
MEDFDNLKLENIFDILSNKNIKIKDTLDNINKLKLNLDTDHIKKLSDVSDNLNNAYEELKEIYYHILDNDNTISKTDEELKNINTIKIDNIIKKTFLPYMMLMKIKLENELT